MGKMSVLLKHFKSWFLFSFSFLFSRLFSKNDSNSTLSQSHSQIKYPQTAKHTYICTYKQAHKQHNRHNHLCPRTHS